MSEIIQWVHVFVSYCYSEDVYSQVIVTLGDADFKIVEIAERAMKKGVEGQKGFYDGITG